MKLSVIMPVYNERGTVLEVLGRVREVPIDKQIIIVDNCSTDGTRELLQKLDLPGVRVVFQATNMQKGNSVKKGIAAAEGEYLVVQDADLEYDPQDHVPMLAEAERDDVVAVLGSRPLGAEARGEKLPSTMFSVGRNWITGYFRLLYGSRLTDIATCYKMMRTEVARSLDLRRNGFDLDFEIACKLTRLAGLTGKRIAEVPIYYAPRSVAEGKKIRWRDGLSALAAITQFRTWTPAGPVVR
ncbi:MAG: glycosyltransferase family 2 protein [Armatimonadetes bacterium]|nr:glycosyltransferase family 2 protein [Armatimonadota bacterium]